MAIVAVGECVDGKVIHDGHWTDGTGKKHFGVSSPMPCEECGGKGCKPKPPSRQSLEDRVETLSQELAEVKRALARDSRGDE